MWIAPFALLLLMIGYLIYLKTPKFEKGSVNTEDSQPKNQSENNDYKTKYEKLKVQFAKLEEQSAKLDEDYKNLINKRNALLKNNKELTDQLAEKDKKLAENDKEIKLLNDQLTEAKSNNKPKPQGEQVDVVKIRKNIETVHNKIKQLPTLIKNEFDKEIATIKAGRKLKNPFNQSEKSQKSSHTQYENFRNAVMQMNDVMRGQMDKLLNISTLKKLLEDTTDALDKIDALKKIPEPKPPAKKK